MSATEPTPAAPVSRHQRLGRHVVPSAYTIDLDVDLDAGTFSGTVDIDLSVHEASDAITLHALDLEIASAVFRSGGDDLSAAVTVDAPTESITLMLPAPLAPGVAKLAIAFSGALNDQLVGFYRSTYTDDEGTVRTIGCTQMEATHARRAFPCWDEPEFKATYAISLTVADGLTAVSNAAEVSAEAAETGRVRHTFAPTMKMSTYLVAWVIGPLEITEPVFHDGLGGKVPIRVVHRPGKGHLTSFALETAQFALGWFEEYYGIAYPGDKVDLLAIPDFAFGAMENLGCITFREVLLLADPATASQPELRRLAAVINHELAHMWFGDLVTMDWWNGIWLNEAFATFMEVACTDAAHPEWNCWTEFGLDRSAAFATDALSCTRPIEFEVHHPDDAEAMFDVLTYEKGASVLRMLEQHIGPESFRSGVRAYLDAHQYANTQTEDLWKALSEASGQPVQALAEPWIFVGGHPKVTAQVTGGSGGSGGATIEFVATRNTPIGSPAVEWSPRPIPVELVSVDAERRSTKLLLGDPEDSTSAGDRATAALDAVTGSGAFIINGGGNGFFRSHLDGPRHDAALAGRSFLTPLERYQLVDDAWSGLLSGATTIAQTVALLAAFADDDEVSVWRKMAVIWGALARIEAADTADGDTPAVRDAVVRVVAPRLPQLDTASEAYAVAVGLVGGLGADSETIARCRAIVGLDSDGAPGQTGADYSSEASPDLVAAATRVVAQHGDADTYRTLRDRWQHAATPQDEQRLLGSLAETAVEDCFAQTLAATLTDVRSQDAPYLLRSCLSHPKFGAEAWKFVCDNLDELTQRFPSNAMPRMFEGVRWLIDPALSDSIGATLGAESAWAGHLVVRQHLEMLDVHRALVARVGDEIASTCTAIR